MKIYAGNLPHATTQAGLRQAFEAHGAVSTADLVTDRHTGESRGFAFVEMPTKVEAKAAIAALDGQDFGGRTLTVNEAKPREERPRNGNGYGGRRY
jgi:RNA recognition motif-containing protein